MHSFHYLRYPEEIARLIVTQLGHITRAQLLAAGSHPSWIERHLQTGELIPIHAGRLARAPRGHRAPTAAPPRDQDPPQLVA
jgi:hypothetical protein